MANPSHVPTNLIEAISTLVQEARGTLQQHVNAQMVQTYWQIGRLIVEHEQQGAARAEYGKQQLQQLAEALQHRVGRALMSVTCGICGLFM